MAEVLLAELEARAHAQVDAVADDPQGRYALREAFYRKYGSGTQDQADTDRPRQYAAEEAVDLPYGYGESELAFLRWEIRRGVLDALPAGSPWWRKVNSEFLYQSQLAMLVHEAPYTGAVPDEIRFWLDYIVEPSAGSWYRAHNASVIRGFLDSIEEARRESSCEQLFMNEVLYRLIFAEALAIGWVGEVGKIAADPRLFAVWLITQMTALYPIHYPLTHEDEQNVQHLGTNPESWIADVLDLDIILPHITELYALVAQIIDQPALDRAIRDGVPIYPDLAPAARLKLLAIREALARERAMPQAGVAAPAAASDPAPEGTPP